MHLVGWMGTLTDHVTAHANKQPKLRWIVSTRMTTTGTNAQISLPLTGSVRRHGFVHHFFLVLASSH